MVLLCYLIRCRWTLVRTAGCCTWRSWFARSAHWYADTTWLLMLLMLLHSHGSILHCGCRATHGVSLALVGSLDRLSVRIWFTVLL